ncbi:MAG: tetratricopeptide repeat protein [Vicinamibacterales bacterium]
MTARPFVWRLVLAGIGVAYAAVLWPTAPGETARRADPFSPEVRAAETALRTGQPEVALQLTAAVRRQFPDDPFLVYLEATGYHALGRWTDEAAAWDRYVRLSGSPGLACPAVVDAYARAGFPDRAGERDGTCAALGRSAGVPALAHARGGAPEPKP